MLWMVTESVSGIPSSTITLPEMNIGPRDVGFGILSGAAMFGRPVVGGVFPGRPPPPPPAPGRPWPNALMLKMTAKQKMARPGENLWIFIAPPLIAEIVRPRQAHGARKLTA